LRFASREELLELTGLVPGSVPPFGRPILPFPLYVDTGIAANDRIAFNAGSLGLRPQDLSCVARRYAALAAALGLQASNERNRVLALSNWVEKLRRDLGMPSTVTAAGVDRNAFLAAVPMLADKAPLTVANFVNLARRGFYDGLNFHRVIADFMIQGGGFNPGMKKERDTRDGIKNESFNGLRNTRGTLAMARTPDPNSATSQFFINTKDNPNLDRENSEDRFGYAVFGRVYDGMDVVDRIRNVPTRTLAGHRDVPINDVVIESIRRITP